MATVFNFKGSVEVDETSKNMSRLNDGMFIRILCDGVADVFIDVYDELGAEGFNSALDHCMEAFNNDPEGFIKLVYKQMEKSMLSRI